MQDKKSNNIKSRYWTFISYPDSMPSNWKEILSDTHLKIAISPLHDKDIILDTGELKKAHYHVILLFEGPTTYNVACSISSLINGTVCKKIESLNGSIRYFTHKDNPEKAQYNDSDILVLNGLCLDDVLSYTETDLDQIAKTILDLIEERNIYEYYLLLDILKNDSELSSNNMLFRFARTNTIFLNNYLKSKKYSHMLTSDKEEDKELTFTYDLEKRLKEK